MGYPDGVSRALPARAVVHMLASEQRESWAAWLTSAQLHASLNAQPSVSTLAAVRGCRGSQEGLKHPQCSSMGLVRWVPGGAHRTVPGCAFSCSRQEPGAITMEMAFGCQASFSCTSVLQNDLHGLSLFLLRAIFLGMM